MRTQEERDAQTVVIASTVFSFVLGAGLVLGAAYVVSLAVTVPDGAEPVVLVMALMTGLLLGARSLRRSALDR